MNIVISGGTGLIGSALTAKLAQEGHHVTVLSRSPEKHKTHLPADVTIERWDGRTTQGWGAVVDGADAVVNLAGETIAGENLFEVIFKRWTPQRKARLRSSRLDAGQALVLAIAEAQRKPRVLVQASAVGYYGDRGEEELNEDSPPGKDFLAGLVQDWEQSTARVSEYGVRHVIIRTPGVVMSLKGGAFPFLLLPFKLFVGGPLGTGRQWFSWIHIQDEVEAIRFLIENPNASGAVNLVAPQAVRNRELSKLLGKLLRRPAFIPMPRFFFNILIGEKTDFLLASQKQVPARLNQLGFAFKFPTLEAALRDLLAR
ncbi:MAG: TIGR01777 family oxidoreductase [Anaerolineales bacterium]|nr:TIGR01777 family oxidoreductase [Anaerolineales bacterium]